MSNNWTKLCSHSDLIGHSGICALVDNQQVALFYLPEQLQVFAVSNYDPVGKANVISRGIIGSSGDDLFVASPLYKERYRLTDGFCLDDEALSLKAWPARIHDGQVEVQLAA